MQGTELQVSEKNIKNSDCWAIFPGPLKLPFVSKLSVFYLIASYSYHWYNSSIISNKVRLKQQNSCSTVFTIYFLSWVDRFNTGNLIKGSLVFRNYLLSLLLGDKLWCNWKVHALTTIYFLTLWTTFSQISDSLCEHLMREIPAKQNVHFLSLKSMIFRHWILYDSILQNYFWIIRWISSLGKMILKIMIWCSEFQHSPSISVKNN